ncbi:hypothetical protein GCM10027047_37010 [Rhodococcus aerolatus]
MPRGPSRRALLRGAGAALLAATAAASGVRPGSPAGAAAAAGPAPAGSGGLSLLRFAYSGDTDGPGAQRFQWQGLQGDLARPAGVATVLVYATAVERRDDPAGTTQCLPPAEVADRWRLRDTRGDVVTRAGGDVALDVGDAALRSRAADFLVAKCRADGWTGVLLDEVNAEFGWGWPGAVPARYPTPQSWQAAQQGFVAALGDALRGAGLSLAGNVAQPLWPEFCLALAAGGMEPVVENFVAGRVGPAGYLTARGGGWEARLAWVERAQAVTSRVVLHDTQTDEAAIRYGLGSFLLVDDGSGVYGASVAYDADPPFPDAYRAAGGLGAPRSSRTEVAPGVWARDFAGGRLVVNATRADVEVAGTAVPATDSVLLAS